MAEEFSGLSDRTAKNALDIRDTMSDLQSLASRLEKKLAGVDGNVKNVSDSFKEIEKSANKVARIQDDVKKSTKGVSKALSEQRKNLNLVRELNHSIDKLYTLANQETGETRDNLLRQAQYLADGRDNAKQLADYFGEIAKDGAKLDDATSTFDALGQIVDKYFGSKFAKPFTAAAEAAREQAFQNAKITSEQEYITDLMDNQFKNGKDLTKQKLAELGLTKITGEKAGTQAKKALRAHAKGLKTQSAMSAGFKAMGPIISKALGPLGLILGAVQAIQALFNAYKQANQQTVDLARTMGTSVQTASVFRQRLREVRTLTGDSRNNLTNQLEAATQLTKQFEIIGDLTDEQLDQQTFLTKRVGATAEQAGFLQMLTFGTDRGIKSSVKSMNELVVNSAKASGVAVTLNTVISDISKAGEEIAGYFGFSNDELTQAVITTRKLGLNLSQSKNIAEGLLDFESSIASELEAELLTGKQFELNRARVLAAQGDIAGATKLTLDQMNNLTEEQRRNPIIMKSIAKATGLTVKELNKAFLLQNNINAQRTEYGRIRAEEGEAAAKRFLKRRGIDQAEIQDIKDRISLSENYQEAMRDIKDQFIGLYEGGSIQLLMDSIEGMANFIDYFFGKSFEERFQDELIRSQGKIKDESLIKKMNERLQQNTDAMNNVGAYRGSSFRRIQLSQQREELYKEFIPLLRKAAKGEEVQLEDFVIKTHPKDTFVMAGGTKLSDTKTADTQIQLLKRIADSIEGGGNVYIDGNLAGKAGVIATYTSS